MQGVPVSVVLSGCGRKTFSEVSHHSNKSGSRFNNYPPYSSRQRALVSELPTHTTLTYSQQHISNGSVNVHISIHNTNNTKLIIKRNYTN